MVAALVTGGVTVTGMETVTQSVAVTLADVAMGGGMMMIIQLCSDEDLEDAVRITDMYGFGDGLYVYDAKFGYGDINDFTFCVTDEGEGSNLGHICGYINESGDGRG